MDTYIIRLLLIQYEQSIYECGFARRKRQKKVLNSFSTGDAKLTAQEYKNLII